MEEPTQLSDQPEPEHPQAVFTHREQMRYTENIIKEFRPVVEGIKPLVFEGFSLPEMLAVYVRMLPPMEIQEDMYRWGIL